MVHSSSSQKSPGRRGAIAVYVGLTLTVLLSVIALEVDGGIMLSDRRLVQSSADAAAMAAAGDLYNGKTKDEAVATGFSVAAANGFNNDGIGNTVVINIPPTAGTFKGVSGYVEAIVTYNQQ